MVSWLPEIEARPGTRARAIADAIGADIALGRLQAGDRLPPQRELADVLGLSPNTVMRGYAEAARRGYLEGQVGRGSYVRAGGGTTSPGVPTSLARPDGGPVDLSAGLPFLGEAGTALARTLAELGAGGGLARFLDQGDGQVRGSQVRAAARWLGGLGLAADAERVVLTTGAQQGIFATLLAVLRPGDALVTEALTYAPLKVLARHLGVRVHAVATDGEGLVPQALDAVCRAVRPAALYCTPTLQTPTTVTMGERRRRQLARIAADHDLTIVEDEVFGFLPPQRPLPLAAVAPERTVLVTSVSKSMGPGLRVGYVYAPRRLVVAVEAAVAVSCWMPPPLMAEVARRWIEDGTAERLVRDQRSHAARRQALAREVLGDRGQRADPHGLHLWLPLPPSWSARAFAATAERAGVLVNPADTFATTAASPPAVRLCLSHETTDDRVRHGLTVVAALLAGPADGEQLVV